MDVYNRYGNEVLVYQHLYMRTKELLDDFIHGKLVNTNLAKEVFIWNHVLIVSQHIYIYYTDIHLCELSVISFIISSWNF